MKMPKVPTKHAKNIQASKMNLLLRIRNQYNRKTKHLNKTNKPQIKPKKHNKTKTQTKAKTIINQLYSLKPMNLMTTNQAKNKINPQKLTHNHKPINNYKQPKRNRHLNSNKPKFHWNSNQLTFHWYRKQLTFNWKKKAKTLRKQQTQVKKLKPMKKLKLIHKLTPNSHNQAI